MDELEKHIDYAASCFNDVRNEFAELEKEYLDDIKDLNEQNDTLGEQNELLEEQVEELNKKLAIFELENMELRLKLNTYELDI
jgi:predicted  nucleic acid-binding Zn-ribbon protein